MIFSKHYSCIVAPLFFVFFLNMSFYIKDISAAESFDNQTIPHSFTVGREMFLYRIDFWLFRNAAKGVLRVEPHTRGVRAVFEAETHGMITIIVGHRREVMESIMEYDHAARRFRPVEFSEVFSYGDRTVKKFLTFDYQLGFYTCVFEHNGNRTLSIKRRLPQEQFEDLLSFLLNLRTGAYGRVSTGSVLRPCMLMKDRPSFITITFPLTHEEPKTPVCKRYVTLSMDPDLTHARSKKVCGWFSEGFVPVAGVVENAYLFGDLNVALVEGIGSGRSASEGRNH